MVDKQAEDVEFAAGAAGRDAVSPRTWISSGDKVEKSSLNISYWNIPYGLNILYWNISAN